MLRKNRLKKEQANLLMWKNKKLVVIGISLLVFGIAVFTITEMKNKVPEDPNGSSGNSVVINDSNEDIINNTGIENSGESVIDDTAINNSDKNIMNDAFEENSEKSTIDNYANVMNYSYVTKASTNSKQKFVHLKNVPFSFIESIEIPGMPDAKKNAFWEDFIFSDAQCPQGICFTEEYVLITCYSFEDDCLGEFMVFDRETGEYLITLGMDKNSHLGGITYDGKNVWVCNSNTKTIERISYDFIQLMATQNKGQVIDATGVVDIYKVKNTPSCITYYNGRLWIATHNKLVESHMVAYYYNSTKDKLISLSTYNIPSQVQGIAFGDKGEIYLCSSYGRKLSSYIRKYESVYVMTTNVNKPVLTIEMPPCAEEIDFDNGELFVIFESAAEKYYEGTDGNGTSLSPLDKILVIDVGEL